ncbi:hypothetical protein [Streptomyces sp. HNM0574]|uniref:hypothetical protein n=1 Tax=Streptomyces sp. HNM0574 TaxID=2714954 RepID=UPI00146A724D|nr:hypothetical protein [Streptomyces sp. HNM0574]NLU69879.1 hypothetical protein [Streptomyces sp. HNM0574]
MAEQKPVQEGDFRVHEKSGVVRVRSRTEHYCVARLVGPPWSVLIVIPEDLVPLSSKERLAAFNTWEATFGDGGVR